MENKDSMSVIKFVLGSTRFGVLATSGEDFPYTSLVAFIYLENFQKIAFSTLKDTRKYENLIRHPASSILITSSKNSETDLSEAAAVTAMGKVIETGNMPGESITEMYLSRFPQLESFVKDPRNTFMVMDVKKYIVVTEFCKVEEINFHYTGEGVVE